MQNVRVEEMYDVVVVETEVYSGAYEPTAE